MGNGPGRGFGRDPAKRGGTLSGDQNPTNTCGMGWLCILIGRDMYATLSGASLIFLALGGLAYTLGVIFYVWDRLPYNHAIWHLFVITGSTMHFFSVLNTLPS